MLAAENLRYHAGRMQILDLQELRFPPGRVHAILGPNGAGKSSLLKLLAGEWRAQQGHVHCNGRDLRDYPVSELAAVRAVLPQTHALSFPFTAAEVVALGRLQTGRHRRQQESAIVAAALDACGASHLVARTYPQLSGGERARVQLARVLAQIWEPRGDQPRYLLLDEPTAHLDLAYQHACMQLARRWAGAGVGVIAVLHDPNLVLSYADSVSVIAEGRLQAHGEPAQVLQPELMQRVFGVQMRREVSAGGRHWLSVTG